MADPKLPAVQWYPGDWRKDPGVQALDYEHRGIWFECCMIMHESERRGRLVLNRRPMPDAAIARTLGLTLDHWLGVRSTLLEYGVASEDPDGALICRRMVRDEELRQKRAEAGRKGGKAGGRPSPEPDPGSGSKKAKRQQTRSKRRSKPGDVENPAEGPPRQAFLTAEKDRSASKPEANGKQNKPPSVSSSVSASTRSIYLPASASESRGQVGKQTEADADELWAELRPVVLQRWHRGRETVTVPGGEPVGMGLERLKIADLLEATDDPEFVRWAVRRALAVLEFDEPATLFLLERNLEQVWGAYCKAQSPARAGPVTVTLRTIPPATRSIDEQRRREDLHRQIQEARSA